MGPAIGTPMTLLVSKILMGLTDLIVKPSVDFPFMYFEGISACVSLTTKHVYCVTPCQLNRLLPFWSLYYHGLGMRWGLGSM